MRPSTRKWILTLLSLLVLFVATTRLEPVNVKRRTYHLVLPPLPDEMAPSMLYTPLLALGRAPLVGVLWLRATKLKEDGRYFDALQLSQRICELQPKFASVWVFQAWNMAYNISVTLKSAEERWRWVRNGYELLRDKGIPLNPNNTQIYRQLAWILFHKVGDFMDDWHYYYKLQFALQMEDILGDPPSDHVQPGRVRGDFYRNYDYQSLADAPLRFEELLEREDVKALVEELATFGFDADKPYVYLKLIPFDRVTIPNTPSHEQVNRKEEFLTRMRDPKASKAHKALESFWRAYRLRNEVKLDPKYIVELQNGLGVSLDFRVAETQALYWASLGVEMGTDKRSAMDIHKLNTTRLEFFCLQKLFHRGRLAMSPEAHLGETPLLSPDMRIVPILRQAYLNDSKVYLKEERIDKVVSENFRTGYVGFMRSAMLRYYELGLRKEAQQLFDDLSKEFPDPLYERGLERFIFEQTRVDRELNDIRVVMSRIEALIAEGVRLYSHDEDDRAVLYFARSKQIYDRYQKNVYRRNKIPQEYSRIVTNLTHAFGAMFNHRATYERVCRKLGIEPLPERQEQRTPAEVSSSE
ncbi:MAG: hypothetical protein MI923_18620 [Phycisphaerales bacterium]|nr:hypothetical protein [Phycisphaerales bacterium]